MNRKLVMEQVELDVIKGFEKYLANTVFEDLELSKGLRPGVITEGDVSVVAWRLTGENVFAVHHIEPAITASRIANAAAGLSVLPRVSVEGATFVNHPGDDVDGWIYHRFIDWNSLAGQIGTSRGRAATPDRIEQVVRFPGDAPGGFEPPNGE